MSSLQTSRALARFNVDYVAIVAAGFKVKQTVPGEVIEASFRLACRCPGSDCRGSVTATRGLVKEAGPPTRLRSS